MPDTNTITFRCQWLTGSAGAYPYEEEDTYFREWVVREFGYGMGISYPNLYSRSAAYGVEIIPAVVAGYWPYTPQSILDADPTPPPKISGWPPAYQEYTLTFPTVLREAVPEYGSIDAVGNGLIRRGAFTFWHPGNYFVLPGTPWSHFARLSSPDWAGSSAAFTYLPDVGARGAWQFTLTLSSFIKSYNSSTLEAIVVKWDDEHTETFAPGTQTQAPGETNDFIQLTQGKALVHLYEPVDVPRTDYGRIIFRDSYGRETEYAFPVPRQIPSRRYAAAAQLPSGALAGLSSGRAARLVDLTTVDRTPPPLNVPHALFTNQRSELWAVFPLNGIPLDGFSRFRLARSRNQMRSWDLSMPIFDNDEFIYVDVSPSKSGGFLAVGVRATGTFPDQVLTLWFRRGSRDSLSSTEVSWEAATQITTLDRSEPFRVMPVTGGHIVVTNGYDLFLRSDDYGRTWEAVAV